MNDMGDDRLGGSAANPPTTRHIAPVPRITIQAFCETPGVARVIEGAVDDRRMSKAHIKVHMGGGPAAVEAYRNAPTPNLIVIEAQGSREALIEQLDELAQFCDAGTKVVVVGRVNDIILYRELISRGVSQYMVAPLELLDFVESISHLYTAPGAAPLGRVIAVVGGKGGVGASTIAHNLAWTIGRSMDLSTVIADLDLGFGTAGLDFNQDPPQGIAEVVFSPDRFDSNMLDRLLSRCSDRLNLLAAPATLDRVYDFSETTFDSLLDVLRTTVPMIVLDVPHVWTGWSKRVISAVDEVVIVAAPDLANLRNVKSIVDTLRTSRPNDSRPKLVMNFVGVPKRPEIAINDFVKAVELDPAAIIPFEPKLFGTAANNGQMIAEVEAASKVAESMMELARIVTGRAEIRKVRRNLLDPFISKLGRKKAS
jgi:pilus assembly protein CpaE